MLKLHHKAVGTYCYRCMIRCMIRDVCMCLAEPCVFIKSLIPLCLCLFSVCLSSCISRSVFLFVHLWPVRHSTNSSFKVSAAQLWADPIGSVSPHCDATPHPDSLKQHIHLYFLHLQTTHCQLFPCTLPTSDLTPNSTSRPHTWA